MTADRNGAHSTAPMMGTARLANSRGRQIAFAILSGVLAAPTKKRQSANILRRSTSGDRARRTRGPSAIRGKNMAKFAEGTDVPAERSRNEIERTLGNETARAQLDAQITALKARVAGLEGAVQGYKEALADARRHLVEAEALLCDVRGGPA